MYFLFRFHDVTPMQYKSMGRGEKKIIKQLMYKELDDKRKENQINGG